MENDKILLTPQQIADELDMERATFLQNVATDPTFPPRVVINSKKFYWFRHDVIAWLEQKKEPRPAL